MGTQHPKNDLNDLTGTEWIKFTRTWFICDSHRYHQNRGTELHPARFPEEMVAEYLNFFTKKGGWVLDPFAGSGATLIACAEEGRRGVGVELLPRYAEVCRKRLSGPRQLALDGSAPPSNRGQTVLNGDARALAEPAFWATEEPALAAAGLPFAGGLPLFNFSISSPPYGAMLHTSRGGVYSKQKQRADNGLDTVYSQDERDVGNIPDHDEFVKALGQIYRGVARLLQPDAYMTIVVQNYRAPSGEVIPLAWDLTHELAGDLLFQGERIWIQNTKPLGIWGYPRCFVPNYHHHYCLIFRNRQPPPR